MRSAPCTTRDPRRLATLAFALLSLCVQLLAPAMHAPHVGEQSHQHYHAHAEHGHMAGHAPGAIDRAPTSTDRNTACALCHLHHAAGFAVLAPTVGVVGPAITQGSGLLPQRGAVGRDFQPRSSRGPPAAA